MTPELISAEVDAAYGDWTGRAVPHLTDLVPLAIGKGIDGDADLAFIATIADGHVRCGLVCGCSLLVGASIRWALGCYFDGDQDRTGATLRLFRDQAAEELDAGDTFLSLVRGDDERWRSFRGERLSSFDERLASVRRDLN